MKRWINLGISKVRYDDKGRKIVKADVYEVNNRNLATRMIWPRRTRIASRRPMRLPIDCGANRPEWQVWQSLPPSIRRIPSARKVDRHFFKLIFGGDLFCNLF